MLGEEQFPRELVAPALSTIGACYWLRCWTEKATEVLLLAGEIARRVVDRKTEGEAFHRLHVVRRDQGEFRQALKETAKARTAFLLAKELPAIGKTFVLDAGAHYYLENFEECCEVARIARHYLDPAETTYYCAAHVSEARGHLALGRIEAAESTLEPAFPLRSNCVAQTKLSLDWLQAEIFFFKGDSGRAAHEFRHLVEKLTATEDANALLVGLDLLKVETARGNGPATAKELKALLPLFNSRRWPPVVKAAFDSLVIAGIKGEIPSEDDIQALTDAFKAAARRRWRAASPINR
jgi:tetratricopeptide (TPR) repeat protein